MKGKFVRWASAAAGLSMALATTNGGITSAAAQSTSSSGNKMTLDVYSTFDSLDPAIAYSTLDYEVVEQLYNTLVTYKQGTSELTGSIAKSWSVSPDGLTYTFQLNRNVKFSDGTPCTAQSFIDEFQRVLSKSVGSPGEPFLDPVVQGSTAYYNGKAKSVAGLSAPNPYTLRIKLTKPEPFFVYALAMPFFAAVNQKYIDSIGNKKFAYQPLGTGPYMMTSYKAGQSMVLKKNKFYFQPGLPKIDEIDVNVETNTQTAVLRFKQGVTGIVANNFQSGLDPADFVTMVNDPQWKNDFSHMTENTIASIHLNNEYGPFKNKLVRQALNMAVNKARLVQLQNGRAQAANQYLAPFIPGYEKTIPQSLMYSYNPAKAKALLKQAGYGDGFKVELLNPPGTPQNLLDSIQTDFKNIGVQMSIRNVTLGAYTQVLLSGKGQMVYGVWSQDFPDPYDFLDVFFNSNRIALGNNSDRFRNALVDKELNQAAVMPNGPTRLALYDKIQNQVLAEAPEIPLFYPIQYAVVQPWVKGFVLNPVLMDPLQYMSIENH